MKSTNFACRKSKEMLRAYPVPYFVSFCASDSGQHELFRDAIKTSTSHNFETCAC